MAIPKTSSSRRGTSSSYLILLLLLREPHRQHGTVVRRAVEGGEGMGLFFLCFSCFFGGVFFMILEIFFLLPQKIHTCICLCTSTATPPLNNQPCPHAVTSQSQSRMPQPELQLRKPPWFCALLYPSDPHGTGRFASGGCRSPRRRGVGMWVQGR
jgi:hypothetical protein